MVDVINNTKNDQNLNSFSKRGAMIYLFYKNMYGNSSHLCLLTLKISYLRLEFELFILSIYLVTLLTSFNKLKYLDSRSASLFDELGWVGIALNWPKLAFLGLTKKWGREALEWWWWYLYDLIKLGSPKINQNAYLLISLNDLSYQTPTIMTFSYQTYYFFLVRWSLRG